MLFETPQGGITSPILFNIYMPEFDMFIHSELYNIIEQKNSKEKRTNLIKEVITKLSELFNREYQDIKKKLESIMSKAPKYEELSYKEKVKDLQAGIKKDYKLRSHTPSVLQSKRYIRIFYVRYADDWIILTNANRKYCSTITNINIIGNKLSQYLELSLEKTKITNLNLKKAKAKFLGFSINTYRNIKFERVNKKIVRTAGYQIFIGIDMDRAIERLVSKVKIIPHTGL